MTILRDDSKLITKAKRYEAVEKLNVFRIWFRERILSFQKAHALLILPIENVHPRYRDETPKYVYSKQHCIVTADVLIASAAAYRIT